MLKIKQIEGLENLANMAIIDMELSDDNTVTLTRADGETFTFITRTSDGEKGETGDKGATGDRGESAYSIARRLSLTNATTSSAWLESLKGNKGADGANGIAGAQGDAGVDGTAPTFTIGTTSWLAAGSAPTLTISQSGTNYALDFGIPSGTDGTAAANGSQPTLKIGTVTMGTTNGGNASASLSQSGNTYSLNMTIPKGSKGSDASASSGAGKNGVAPDISFNVNYVANGTTPSVSYSGNQGTVGSDWTRTVNLNIPKGVTGDVGDRGAQGANGSSTTANPFLVNLSDAGELDAPGTGLSAICGDDAWFNPSTPYSGQLCWFGFSWKTSTGEAYQVAWPQWMPGYTPSGTPQWTMRYSGALTLGSFKATSNCEWASYNI